MKKALPTLALLTLALLAAVVCYDLGAAESRLLQWIGKEKGWYWEKVANPKEQGSGLTKTEVKRDQLRDEARAIWANAAKMDHDKTTKSFWQFFEETDPEKRYELLKAVGISLSRTRFNQVLNTPVQQDGLEKVSLFRNLVKAWCDESPREAVAWMQNIKGSAPFSSNPIMVATGITLINCLCYSLDAIQRDPAAWLAFLKEGPEPLLETWSQRLLQEIQQPGSFWADKNISEELQWAYIATMIEGAAPDKAVRSIVKCPDEDNKRVLVLQIIYKQSPDSLRRFADIAEREDPNVANLYRALAGDAQASFAEASRYLTGDGYNPYAEETLKQLYSEWFKNDGLEVALRHVAESERKSYIATLMQFAVAEGKINEESLVRYAASIDPSKTDPLFVALYTAQHNADYRSILERILHSKGIEDQVESSLHTLTLWSHEEPAAAAQWFQRLPTHRDFPELATRIAGAWSGIDPEAAIDFIVEQGLGFEHGFKYGLTNLMNQHDVSDATLGKLMKSLKSGPEYDQLVLAHAANRLSQDPTGGLRFLKDHARSPWQTALVDQFNAWHEAKDSRAKKLVPTLLGLDLSSVPKEKMKIINAHDPFH